MEKLRLNYNALHTSFKREYGNNVNYYCEDGGFRIKCSNERDERAYESRILDITGVHIPLELRKAYDIGDYVLVERKPNEIFVASKQSYVPRRLELPKANPLPDFKDEYFGVLEKGAIALPEELKILGERTVSVKFGLNGNYVLVQKGKAKVHRNKVAEFFGNRFQYLESEDYSYGENSRASERKISLPANFIKKHDLKTKPVVIYGGKDCYAIVPMDVKCDVSKEMIDMSKSGKVVIKVSPEGMKRLGGLK